MPARPNTYAVWDRFSWFPGSVISVQVAEPTEPAELRRWHRTRLYDEAAAQLRDGRSFDAAAEQIQRDFEQRHAAFRGTEPDTGAPSEESDELVRGRGRTNPLSTISYWAPVLGATAAAVGLAASPIDSGLRSWLLVILASTAITTLLAPWIPWLGKDPLPRAAERLRRGACGDCGYNLAGAPAGLPVEVIGVNVGPAACPECGAPWPLVPPSATPATGVYPGPQPP